MSADSTTVPSPAKGEETQCPACDQARHDGALFCPQCGKPIRKVTEALPRPQEPPGTIVSTATDVAGRSTDDPQGQAAKGWSPLPLAISDTRPPAQHAAAQRCTCGQVLPEDAQFCYRCGVCVGVTPPRFRLVSRGPERARTCANISGEELSIGKAEECDLVISDDAYVSRRHARITLSNGMLFLEDLASANGTFLRVRRAIALEPGDELVFGTTVFQLEEVGL